MWTYVVAPRPRKEKEMIKIEDYELTMKGSRTRLIAELIMILYSIKSELGPEAINKITKEMPDNMSEDELANYIEKTITEL